MGFLYLFIAAILNATKSYCSKKISDRVETVSDTVDMTVLRNALCVVIGAFLIMLDSGGDFRLPAAGWGICLIAGVMIGANYVVWVLSLKSGVYLLASTANSASFIIAALCGIFLFNEQLTVIKGVAIALILLAVLFMSRYQKEQRGSISPVYVVLLLSIFLTAGVSSVTQKWFTRTLPDTSAHIYTFYSLLISLIVLLIVSFALPSRKALRTRIGSMRKILPTVVIMAVCFYGVTYFQTIASSVLEAVVMYPLYNGTLLAAGSLMAWLCFSEKPSKNSVVGIIFVFAAVVLAGM